MRTLQVVAELGTGGAEAVVLGLAEGMASRGHRTWVASDRGWRVPLVADVPGVDHVRVPLAPRGPVAVAASAARLLAWAPGRPVDLVHAHNIRATLAAHPVARARRVPLVTTVHGLGAQDYRRAVRALQRPGGRGLRCGRRGPAARGPARGTDPGGRELRERSPRTS